MRIITTTFLLFLLYANAIAQSWSPMGTGMNNTVLCTFSNEGDDTVYAGGRFTVAGGKPANRLALYTNGQWTQLGNGLDNTVRCITAIEGKLFAGGEFSFYKDTLLSCFAEWNGTRFVHYAHGFFKSGQHAVLATVNSIVSYKNELYAGGTFDLANSKTDYVPNIARWNGTKWESVGGGVDGSSGVNSMIVFHDTLYVAGGFTTAGGAAATYIAKWDGTTWATVGGGTNGEILSLESFNDTLYACGVFTMAGGNNISSIAKLSGNTWQAVGTGVNGPVFSLKAIGSNLYAGGLFSKAGNESCSNLAVWNGTAWTGAGNTDGIVWSVTKAAGLLIAGDFNTIDGVQASKIGQFYPMTRVPETEHKPLLLYPNPVTDFLHIESSSSNPFEQISLYDLNGKEVMLAPYATKLDMSTLKEGNYLLVVKGSGTAFRKMITKGSL